jgi:glycosyltransferase involved in cell wall biosynthesis
MLVVSLLTLGDPQQLTGGYLYHRRMAEHAPDHDARIDFVSVSIRRNPLTSRRGADVVLIDSIAAARVAPWVWRRSPGAPLAAVLHQPPGGIDGSRVRRRAQHDIDQSLYRRCQLLLAASEALADELVEIHHLPLDRIRVVAPGSDAGPPFPKPPDLRQRRPVAFLSVGNWMARKGTLDLLEAFAHVASDAAVLHLVGRDDIEPRYAARVRSRLAEPDLRSRVVVHGPRPREEVAGMYHAADAFVLPSYVEPYGTVYGEALAAGLPIVGWSTGNAAHLVQNGESGLLVAPGDIAELASALARIAGDNDLRCRLAGGARERGRQLPTWHQTATAFFGALRDLAPEHAR